MRVRRIGEAADTAWGEVEELLAESDHEFFPPLSLRWDTQSLLTVRAGQADLSRYVSAMKSETVLTAQQDGPIVGLLSYIENYRSEELADWSPSAYVTTITVSPRYRRQGLGRALYASLADWASRSGLRYLTTRTWGTNSSHLHLLASAGFREVYRVPDGRASGVDTVGLARRLDPVDLAVGAVRAP